jgi:hypothetical protein
VIYLNKEKAQLVLAHRGTVFSGWDLVKADSSLKTDLVGILFNNITVQQANAF